MAWNIGDKLKDGKYTIQGVLGKGGFGITYCVRDENGRQFALKTLNDEAIAEPNFAKLHEDFMNEALKRLGANGIRVYTDETRLRGLEKWYDANKYSNIPKKSLVRVGGLGLCRCEFHSPIFLPQGFKR